MRKLFVLRHGKASKDFEYADDYIRNLNKKGIAQINQIGYILRESGVKSDEIISSKARRTFETTQIANHYINCSEVSFHEDLYLCSQDEIAKKLCQSSVAGTRLYVGHNNGISYFVNWLCEENLIMNTGMLIEIDIEIDEWAELSEGLGRIVKTTKPDVLTF